MKTGDLRRNLFRLSAYNLLGAADDAIQRSLVHTVGTIHRHFTGQDLVLGIVNSVADILGDHRLVDLVVRQTDGTVRQAEDLILAVRQLTGQVALDRVIQAVAYALDGAALA